MNYRREKNVTMSNITSLEKSVYKISDYADKPEVLAQKIFEYLLVLEKMSHRYTRYYFNGAPDCGTKYDKLCNYADICVTAKEERVAKCLHTFLRTFIDDHPNDYFMSWLEDSPKDEFTMEEIVDLFAETNSSYSQCFDPVTDGLYVKVQLRRPDREITKYIGEVSTWSIYRIADEFAIIQEF